MTVKVTKPAINVREELADLRKPSGVAGEAMLRAETPQEQFNLIGAGRRNLVINGSMAVWQRGTSLSTYGYIADRYRMSIYSGSVDSSRVVSGLDDFTYAYRIANNTGVFEFEQRIEGINIPNSANEMTISFWVRGSKTGTIRTGRLINNSTGATNSGFDHINVSTSWERISLTTTNQPSTDPSQYYRLFVLDDMSNYFSAAADWIEITGVQLELGKVATPFEHRSYGEELAACQRFYEQLEYGSGAFIDNGWSGSTSGATAVLRWQTPKRTNPTITLPSASNSNGILFLTATGSYPSTIGTHNTTSLDTFSCRVNGSGYSGLGGGGLVSVLYVVGANSIKIDAEL